jgi:hypothetical protein
MSALPPPCPSCGERSASSLRSVDRVLFRCRRCGSIHDGGHDGGALPVVRPLVPMPRGITVEAAPAAPAGYRDAPTVRRLVLVHRWYSGASWGMLLFTLVWLAFATRAGRELQVVPVLMGVIVLYVSLAGLVNRTTFAIADEVLTIRHGPLPWPGKRDLPVREIAQLYCEEEVVRHRNGSRSNYHLGAVMRDGTKRRLVANLPAPEHALFLEQRLEEHLGIADVPVEGEYAGR